MSFKNTTILPSKSVVGTKYEDKKSKKKRYKAKKKRWIKESKESSKDTTFETREEMEAPKSFIVVRGRVTSNCKLLRDNLRHVFSPFTAAKLKERSNNILKDFTVAAKDFGVTHIITLSQSLTFGTMLRFIRLPNGPTFYFKIENYSLIKDILNHKRNKTKKKPFYQNSLKYPPLVVLNGFNKPLILSKNVDSKYIYIPQNTNVANDETRVKHNRCQTYHKILISEMLKHMFPPMNIASMKLKQCKRIVLFNYNLEEDTIDLRHYKIRFEDNLNGISRNIKKVLKHKKNIKKELPDLSGFKDIEDYVFKNESGSESEFEDTKETIDLLNLLNIHSNNANQKKTSFVRLQEIGPRLTISLYKIEQYINTGKVLFHRYYIKSMIEIQMLENKKLKQYSMKQQRKLQQKMNIERKFIAKKSKFQEKIERKKEIKVEELLKQFQNNDGQKESKKSLKRNKKDLKGHQPPTKRKKIHE